MSMFQWLKQFVHRRTTEDSSDSDHTSSLESVLSCPDNESHHHPPFTPPSSPTDLNTCQAQGVESDGYTQCLERDLTGQDHSSSPPSPTQPPVCEAQNRVVHEDYRVRSTDHLDSLRSLDEALDHADSLRSSDEVLDHLDSVRSPPDNVQRSHHMHIFQCSQHRELPHSLLQSTCDDSTHICTPSLSGALPADISNVSSVLEPQGGASDVDKTVVDVDPPYDNMNHVMSVPDDYGGVTTLTADDVGDTTSQVADNSDLSTPIDVGSFMSQLTDDMGKIMSLLTNDTGRMTSLLTDDTDRMTSTLADDTGRMTSLLTDDTGRMTSLLSDDTGRMMSASMYNEGCMMAMRDDVGSMWPGMTDADVMAMARLMYGDVGGVTSLKVGEDGGTNDVDKDPGHVADVEGEPSNEDSTRPGAGSTTTVVGLSPEEKEKRKILNKAGKKLLKVNRRATSALEESATASKALQEKLDKVEANRSEVEKALNEHVKYLHSLLDYHHKQQQNSLKQHHKDFLTQLMINRTEGLNYESKLKDCQKRVEDTLQRVFKDRDVTAADNTDVTALCDDFHRVVSAKPSKQVPTLTYLVEIPQVTADDLQTLVGHFIVRDNTKQTQPTRPYPEPRWPTQKDPPAAQTPGSGTSSSSSSQHSATGHKAGQSTKPPPPQTSTGGPTYASAAARNAAKGQKVKEAARPSTPQAPEARASREEVFCTEQRPPSSAKPKDNSSAKPKENTASLGSKQKLSETMASSSYTEQHPSSAKPKVNSSAKPKENTASLGSKQKLSETMASSSYTEQHPPSSAKPKDSSSAKPKENTAFLGSKQKLSETMASSSSIASSIASSCSTSDKKAKKRARSRRRRKEKKAEAEKETMETPKPAMITLLHEDAQPKKIPGRKKEARGFAARPEGEVWVVYGDRDPHLDCINEEGTILESFRIGGNAIGAAIFSNENVLVAVHSPCCQLRLLDEQKESRETIKLPLTPTGLGVGSTGIAVSSYTSLYWIPLDGGKNEWIVKQKASPLKNVCACDVIIIEGREIVCVADSDGHKVWFFEKLDNGEFAPLPLFTYVSHSKKGKTTPFCPVSLSALAGSSFLAVLDEATRSVIMVDVEKNEVVSVISNRHLCDGSPSLVTFALTDPRLDPKLWVTSDSGCLYLVSLAFLY